MLEEFGNWDACNKRLLLIEIRHQRLQHRFIGQKPEQKIDKSYSLIATARDEIGIGVTDPGNQTVNWGKYLANHINHD